MLYNKTYNFRNKLFRNLKFFLFLINRISFIVNGSPESIGRGSRILEQNAGINRVVPHLLIRLPVN